MGTISNKLTYLNTTKGKIKDSINLTGAGITNQDTFRNYEKKLKDGLVDIINNGTDTVYNNFPKVTGTGSSATLNSTYQAPMKVGLKGNTYQGSDPTPSSPQDIEVVTGYNEVEVIGKNIFDNINLLPKYSTSNTIAVSIENGKQIKYTGSSTVTGAYLCAFAIMDLTNYIGKTVRFKANFTASGSNKGRYFIGLSNADGSNRTKLSEITTSDTLASFVVPELSDSQTYLCLALYVNHSGTLMQNDYINYTNTILTIDNEYMTYEPYQSQSYEINLGKNLFDKSNANTLIAYINSNGKIIQDVFPTIIYISCKPNTKYTLQKALQPTTASNRFKVGCCSSTPNINTVLSEYNNLPNGTTDTTMIFETDSTAKYLVFNFAGGSEAEVLNEINTIQIEEGSTATPYSAYKTPIEMCKIGDYQDEIRCSTGKNLLGLVDGTYSDNGITATVNNGKITLNGTASANSFVEITMAKNINVKANTDYTLSANNSVVIGSSSNYADIRLATSSSHDTATSSVFHNQNSSNTFNKSEDTIYTRFIIRTGNGLSYNNINFTIYPQLEQNNQATDYEPYGIGVWYKYGKIGKVVLNGSEDWGTNGENTNYGQYIYNVSGKVNGTLNILSNKFINESGATGNYIYGRPNDNRISITIAKSICSYNIDTFKTWLSNNGVYYYYILATPTATILDTELQTQLNNLKGANSYASQTNITAEYITGNQPFIMNLVALKDE